MQLRVDGLNGMNDGAGMYMSMNGNGSGGMSVIQETQSSGASDACVSTNLYMSYHVNY